MLFCIEGEGFMKQTVGCTLLWKYTRSTSDGGNVGLNLQMGCWWRCCEAESVGRGIVKKTSFYCCYPFAVTR